MIFFAFSLLIQVNKEVTYLDQIDRQIINISIQSLISLSIDFQHFFQCHLCFVYLSRD